MEKVKEQILSEQFEGLGTKTGKQLYRAALHQQQQEDQYIRELAQQAILNKSTQPESSNVQHLEGEYDEHVLSELADLKKVITESGDSFKLIACSPQLISVELCETRYSRLLIKIVLPERYPQVTITPSLTAPTLAPQILAKLADAATAAATAAVGSRQLLPVIQKLYKLLSTNRLATAYDDLALMRALCTNNPSCSITQVKEKTGSVSVHLSDGAYFWDTCFTVPKTYPEHPAEMVTTGTNIPEHLIPDFTARCKEIGVRLALPPSAAVLAVQHHEATLKAMHESANSSAAADQGGSGGKAKARRQQGQHVHSRQKENELKHAAESAATAALSKHSATLANFVSQPSMYPMVDYLYNKVVVVLGSGKCGRCGKRLVPSDPDKLQKVPPAMATLMLTCGHVYHKKCVHDYVSAPPFGKTCDICGAKMEARGLMSDARILEQRWTAKQRQQREVDDVLDFFNM